MVTARTRRAAASLRPGDRIILTPRPWPLGITHRVQTVDHVVRDDYGVVRVFYGRHGLQSVTAAGTYRFDVAA